VKHLHGVRPAYIITNMLEVLHLKNVVLVKDMLIDFSRGFNVITGETGAGKSLIIKSLELLLGANASDAVIHPEEDMAFIEATFLIKDPSLVPSEYLDQERLTVSRRIHRNRPTVNKLNFESVPLKELKRVMQHVVFLTAQHQVMDLMDASKHLGMFDQFIGKDAAELNSRYHLEYKTYQDLKQQSQNAFEKSDALTNEINELSSLISDIDAQDFSVEEEDSLVIQQKKCEDLNHRRGLVQKVLTLSNEVMEQVHAMDAALSELNQAGSKKMPFDSLNALEDLAQLHQAMANERMEIEYLESIDLDEVNARLNHIFHYKVKYRVNSLSELLALRDYSKEKLTTIDVHMSDKDEIRKKVAIQYRKLVDVSIELSELRKRHVESFEYVVLNQIRQLGMVDAQFKLAMHSLDDFTHHGQDDISFLFSANPNMPLQPLKKVASGGELSRVLLALLVSNNGALKQPLVVFDEIDVGIGGMTANYIGTMLQTMAEGAQLIVVTHLPQIARCAHHHFKILKTIENGQSCVSMNQISKDDVPIELQRMVGGDVVASIIK
jgi:DNA repair protein RecN (Recombination protein N)